MSLLDSWKAWATGDAERRGLTDLKPILEGLAALTARLRATRWQTAADGRGLERVDATPVPGHRIDLAPVDTLGTGRDEVAGV
jgi:hypothetical protein